MSLTEPSDNDPPLNQIEEPDIDDQHNDDDSIYAESSLSLSSSDFQFMTENGRTYHSFDADEEYWAPNDGRQQEVEDLCHVAYLLAMDDQLLCAPIKSDVQNVLDLGCGTGIWAMDFADRFPSAVVRGIDLSPIQPPWVPPNCLFEIDNFNKHPWNFRDKYDVVHLRALNGSVKDWEALFKDILRSLKPGGFVEHVELCGPIRGNDRPLPPDSQSHRLHEIFQAIGEKTGKTFMAHEKSREYMEQAGFVDIKEERARVPIGSWAKDPELKVLGTCLLSYLNQGLEGFVLRGLTKVLGWQFPEVLVFTSKVRKELKDINLHTYLEVRVIYGRKPSEWR